MASYIIDPEVAEVLDHVTGNERLIFLPDRQLSRDLYTRVNRVLANIGGKWDRKQRAHVFPPQINARMALADALDDGFAPPWDDKSFYPTPPALAERVVELAELDPQHIVLEPSAGEGALADLAAEIVGECNVLCFELDSHRADVLRRKGYEVVEADFMETATVGAAPVVVIEKGEEIWRPVVGFEEFYEVSSWGEVRRLQTRKGHLAGTLLTPSPRTDGYLNVVLAADGERKSKLLHQIVAEAFIGPRPDGMQINHRHPDGDKSRCWASNLEYTTSAKNNEDQRAHRPADYASRERNGLSVLKDWRVTEIRRDLANGLPVKQIAHFYDVAEGTIYAIRDGKSWSLQGRRFDRAILNPPFERKQEIDHVTLAYGLLKPGGRLVSVMSAGVTFREDAKTAELRSLIEQTGTIHMNPPDAFKPSGTTVNTCIVVMNKPGDE